jgi:cell division protein FtsW
MGEDQGRKGMTGEQPPTRATSGRTGAVAAPPVGRTGGATPPTDRAAPAGAALRGLDAAGGLAALRGLLARPLASYYLLIASSGLLLVIGLTMVFSATSVKAYAENGSAFTMLTKQAIFAFIGLVAFWACQRLPIRTFRAVGGPVLVLSLVLLLVLDLVLAWAWLNNLTGVARLGPLKADLNWLFLGPLQVQPSELAKFGMVLWGADVVARKGAALGWWRELAMPIFPAVGLLFLLVGYNDLGTMLCLLAIVVGLFWAAGVRLRIFATLSAIGLVGVGLLIAAASIGGGSGTKGEENYRLLRLTTFISPPENCKQDYCYQLIQARNAIDHGGWFGVGLGKSTFKWDWLPAAHNDFIFAVLAEELGVVGCAVVLILFAVLAYTGLRIARRVDGPFRRLAAAAVTTWLISQAVINIAGVVGLLPITGLPLPFISDGGSALLVTLAAVGLLASLARAEPDAARALNARPPARWVRLLWAPLPPLPAASGRSAKRAPAVRDTEPRSGRRSDANARPNGGRVTGVRAGKASERRR